MKRRIIALLLALVLMMPPAALAADAGVVRFADIRDTETALAVESLRLMNVLDGYRNGTFQPDTVLNRAQFCKMAVYAMNGEEELGRYQTVTVFPDVKPSYWAAAYINMAAKGKNIISGYVDGQFHPDRTVTVGQAVTILMRLLGYKDENVGGIWPHGYMAEASVVGLTDGLHLSAGDGLTRGEAARLFVNLLRCDMAEGGSYVEGVLKCSTVANSMLVSCEANGSDGHANALQLSNGNVYSLRSGKTSNGSLNGTKGVMIVDSQGQALTFLPDETGDSRTITVASAKSGEITDLSGNRYTVKTGINAFYKEGEKPWSEVYSWLNPGSSITIYLNSAGVVEYVFAGGGASSESAVVVHDRESTVGFSDLTGGASGYKIFKNGAEASVADLRIYDVATYSSATNSIRVCDTKITAYYRSCAPNPQEPQSITVFEDTKLEVLSSAWESLSRFNPGDLMTILLTEDNKVAAVLKANTSDGAMGNAMGIVKSISSGSATVDLLCGLTVSGSGTYLASTVESMSGQMVRVASDKKGALGLSRPVSGASGDLNVEKRTLGGKDLAKNVMVFRNTAGTGIEAISLDDLEQGTLSSTEIGYVRLNWKDEVDLIVIGSGLGSSYVYGIAEFSGSDGKVGTLTVTSGNRTVSVQTPQVANTGEVIGVSINGSGPNTYLSSVVRPMEIKDVPNSAWTGRNSVTVSGRTYTVANSVPCYNARTKDWVTLDEAHAYAEKADLYIHNGAVRLIQVR